MSRANPIPIVLTEQEANLFWKHVNKSAGQGPQGTCWEWTGGRSTPNPYGLFNLNRKGTRYTFLAHRLAYYLQKNNPNELLVCHHCDNHPCVRKDHLFLGTYQDNKTDSIIKGRHFRGPHPDKSNFTRGEQIHCAKLSNREVTRIVELQEQGLTATQIHRLGIFPVSRRSIAYVLEGQTWKHI